MKYIVHYGTGTVIAVEECVVVDVSDEILADLTTSGGDDYFDDNVICDLALEIGTPINTSDLTYGNCMAFSPDSLREEAQEILDLGLWATEEQRKAMEWCVSTATNDQLNEVAGYILNDDTMWSEFRSSVLEGLAQGLRWNNEVNGDDK